MRAELGPDVPLRLVPDPVETPATCAGAGRHLVGAAQRRRAASAGREVAGGVRRDVSKLRPRLAAKRPRRGPPQVIWFGNVGSVQPRFGLINLIDIADELAAAAAEEPFRLLVVSGDRGAYERRSRAGRSRPTSRSGTGSGSSATCAAAPSRCVPNSRDEFSACKSPNRVVHALSQGVPVVATRIASTEPFDGCVAFDDFAGGIVSYLRDRELAEEHVRRGREVIERDSGRRGRGPRVGRGARLGHYFSAKSSRRGPLRSWRSSATSTFAKPASFSVPTMSSSVSHLEWSTIPENGSARASPKRRYA